MSPALTVPSRIAPLLLVFGLLTAPAVLAQSASEGTIGTASAQNVFKRIPVVSSDAGRSRSIKLGGYVSHIAGAHLAFVARYRAPGHFALDLVDEATRAPLARISDARCVVYDPVNGGVFFFGLAKFEISLLCREGRLYQNFSMVNAGGRSKFLLEGKSLFDGKGQNVDFGAADGGDFRLTTTTGAGDYLIAIVAPSRRWQIRQLELISSGTREPRLAMRDLSVDERSVEPWPHVPTKARLKRELHLEDCSGPGVDAGTLSSIIDRAFWARLALQNSEIRPEFERRYNVQVDWRETEINDRKVSEIVRRLLDSPSEDGNEDRAKGGIAKRAR
jgi:hypothetical protein